MDRFNEFYMMQTQAKKFEQSGMDDKALDLYLKIIGDYQPNNDFSFDRAATLLEKKFQYPQALEVCQKAIALIEKGELQGDAAKFRVKLTRIQQKVKEDQQFQTAVTTREPEEFHFGIPGFRSHRKPVMLAAIGYYCLAAFAAYPDRIYVFLFLLALAFFGAYGWEALNKGAQGKRLGKALTVTLLSLGLAGYFVSQMPQVKAYWATDGTNPPEEQTEVGTATGAGTGTEAPPDTDREPPEIPEKYLIATAKAAELHPATEIAEVTAAEGQVLMDLVVKAGTSQEQTQEIVDEMLKTLGGLMITERLKGPSEESFGEVYDFYSVSVSVYDTLEEPVAEGRLPKGAASVQWQSPQ